MSERRGPTTRANPRRDDEDYIHARGGTDRDHSRAGRGRRVPAGRCLLTLILLTRETSPKRKSRLRRSLTPVGRVPLTTARVSMVLDTLCVRRSIGTAPALFLAQRVPHDRDGRHRALVVHGLALDRDDPPARPGRRRAAWTARSAPVPTALASEMTSSQVASGTSIFSCGNHRVSTGSSASDLAL